MLAADGTSAWAPPRARIDSAMVKAVGRAYRWRGMLEQGEHASITELAAAEKINQSYVCRVLRLTLLAPALVEAILDGRHPRLQLRTLLNPFPWIGLPKHTTSHKQSAKPGNDGKPPCKRRPNNDLSGICRVIHGGECERKVLA